MSNVRVFLLMAGLTGLFVALGGPSAGGQGWGSRWGWRR